MSNRVEYTDRDPFPNLKGGAKFFGWREAKTLPPEYVGWGPWKKQWGSICSRHHPSHRSEECDLCRVGGYRNILRSKMSRLLFRVSPPLWRWQANLMNPSGGLSWWQSVYWWRRFLTPSHEHEHEGDGE